MSKDDWLELTVLEKKKYNYLVEIQDLTRQLAESLDRNDQVSTRMLVAMRQEPLLQLEELKQAVEAKETSLLPQERERVSALREGAAPKGEEETIYHNQVGSVRRLLERVIALDERLNRRLAGGKSFYSRGK